MSLWVFQLHGSQHQIWCRNIKLKQKKEDIFQNRLIVTWIYHTPKHIKNSRRESKRERGREREMKRKREKERDHCIMLPAAEILYELLAWMNLHYQQAHSQLPVYFLLTFDSHQTVTLHFLHNNLFVIWKFIVVAHLQLHRKVYLPLCSALRTQSCPWSRKSCHGNKTNLTKAAERPSFIKLLW